MDLAAVLGLPLEADTAERLKRVEDRLLGLPRVGPAPWWWAQEADDGEAVRHHHHTRLGIALTAWQASDDWSEMDLDLTRDTSGQMWVIAEVGVACMCETNHNMHYVRRWEWQVGSAGAATHAMEEATEVIAEWFRAPWTGPECRRRAGLPDSG